MSQVRLISLLPVGSYDPLWSLGFMFPLHCRHLQSPIASQAHNLVNLQRSSLALLWLSTGKDHCLLVDFAFRLYRRFRRSQDAQYNKTLPGQMRKL